MFEMRLKRVVSFQGLVYVYIGVILVFILILLRQGGGTPPSSPPVAPIPLVYIFYANDIPADHYQWTVIRKSGAPRVVLLAYKGVKVPAGIKAELYWLDDLETPQLHAFRRVYAPWGLREPWERQNTERYFYLHSWMLQRNETWAIYADSDVLMMNVENLKPSAACDSVLDWESNLPGQNNVDSLYFVVWAGSSLLRVDVLGEFLQFATQMYNRENLPLLQLKKEKAPYPCDMSHWYLFVGATNRELAKEWGWPNSNLRLPKWGKQFKYCDGMIPPYNLDHKHGFRGDKKLASIHYQGEEKWRINTS